MSLKFKIKVPGTSANIGVGYDCLGVALDYYLEIEVTESETIEFVENGKEFSIPLDENLMFEAANFTQKKLNKTIPNYRVNIIRNDIPIARGLGSSSSAIVAGIMIVNRFLNNKLDRDSIAKLAVEMEGHPDNVVPAIFGGMVLAAHDKENLSYALLPNIENLFFYVMIPNFRLSTEKARSVLPKNYKVSDAINNMSKLGLLVSRFYEKKYDDLRFLLGDRLHQPYRFKLINNSEKIFKITEEKGAIAEYISGAGPTLLDLNYDNDNFLEAMKNELSKLPDEWSIEKKRINYEGAMSIDLI